MGQAEVLFIAGAGFGVPEQPEDQARGEEAGGQGEKAAR